MQNHITITLRKQELQLNTVYQKTPDGDFLFALLNLTGTPERGHDVNLMINDKTITIPPSGVCARCEVCDEADESLSNLLGIPFVKKMMGNPSIVWNGGAETIGDFGMQLSKLKGHFVVIVSRDALLAIKQLAYNFSNIIFASPGDGVFGDDKKLIGVKNLCV